MIKNLFQKWERIILLDFRKSNVFEVNEAITSET